MNGYQLTRQWFSFRFENSHKVSAAHTEFYFYLLDRWNRFGQKDVFSCPRILTMEVLGIGSQNTYKRIYQDLIAFGFLEEVSKACNRYKESSYVRLSKTDTLHDSLSDSLPDNLSDILSDTIIELKNKGIKEPKKGDFDFLKYGDLSELIKKWVDYKKSIKKSYKSQSSLDIVAKKLLDLSEGDYQKAQEIVEQSIGNQWQGLFELNKQAKHHQNANQTYYPPKPENDPILLRQEVHSNYEDYVRHCLKVNHQPEKPKYPELVPPDFDHIAFINQIKANL
jgi:hypothetical protein